MNFEKLNMVAKGDQRTVKKIVDLELDRLYEIERIRKSHTSYGEKVVIDIKDEKGQNVFCYLPKRVGELLLADEEGGLKEIQSQMEVCSVSIRRIKGRYNPVEFVIQLPDENLEDFESKK